MRAFGSQARSAVVGLTDSPQEDQCILPATSRACSRSWRRCARRASGCPWDLEQDFATIAPYTLEEAYEVAEAIARGDLLDLKDELGDLLLQVVFHARMAEEAGAFDFGDVVESITGKLIRRHPHVFGDARDLSPAGGRRSGARSKKPRRQNAGASAGIGSPPQPAFAGVPAAARPRPRRKAHPQGRDRRLRLPDAAQVVGKIEEEVREVREALQAGARGEIEDEVGDLLFAVVNLARHAGVDPELALRARQREVRAPLRRRRAGACGAAAERPPTPPSTTWKTSG